MVLEAGGLINISKGMTHCGLHYLMGHYPVVVRVDAFDWEGQLSPGWPPVRRRPGSVEAVGPQREWHGLGPAGADIPPGHLAVDHGTGAAVVDTRSISRNPGGGAAGPIGEVTYRNASGPATAG